MTPAELKQLFSLWIICTVNSAVLNSLVIDPEAGANPQQTADYTAIANKIGVNVDWVKDKVNKVQNLDAPAAAGTTTLASSADIFSQFAFQSGYNGGGGGNACGSIEEILAAL